MGVDRQVAVIARLGCGPSNMLMYPRRCLQYSMSPSWSDTCGPRRSPEEPAARPSPTARPADRGGSALARLGKETVLHVLVGTGGSLARSPERER